eukprot:9309173-Pyramimonas_sp.AAC.1
MRQWLPLRGMRDRDREGKEEHGGGGVVIFPEFPMQLGMDHCATPVAGGRAGNAIKQTKRI